MNHIALTTSMLPLLLCLACEKPGAPASTTITTDSTAITQQPNADSIDEDAKQPFEYDIDTLYHGQAPNPNTGYYGEFDGDEPYWSILFQGEKLAWIIFGLVHYCRNNRTTARRRVRPRWGRCWGGLSFYKPLIPLGSQCNADRRAVKGL